MYISYVVCITQRMQKRLARYDGVLSMIVIPLHQKWIHNKYNCNDDWLLWLQLAYEENMIFI